MKFPIKKFIANLLTSTGTLHLIRTLFPSRKIAVLMYHQVDPKHFEKQIVHLKKYYNPISEKELYNYYYNKGKVSKNSVLITFDDGYYNNYKYAYPILKKHKVPGLIFLVSGLINKQEFSWYDKVEYLINNTKQKKLKFDSKEYKLNKKNKKILLKSYYYYIITANKQEIDMIIKDLVKQCKVPFPKIIPEKHRFMTWDQANEMKDWISFGSHTHTHPVVPNINLKDKEFELKKSKNIIKEKIGVTPLSFCFPNGDFDKQSIDIVKSNKYKLSFSTIFGRIKSNNPFVIKRIGINIKDNWRIFAVKLSAFSKLFNHTKKSTKFKVVMITNYYKSQPGGITTVLTSLNEYLINKKISVCVLPFPQIFRKLEKLTPKGFLHKIFVLIFALYSVIYIGILKLFYKSVIVHSHSANFCGFIGFLSKFVGAKTIHTFHTHSKMNKNAKRATYLNKLDKLTAVSNALGKDAQKAYQVNKKIITIYNGIENKQNKQNKTKQNKLEILFVGHLFDIKDPILFIKSVQELSKKISIHATMVGEGNLKEEVEKYIIKNKLTSIITLTGLLSREKVEKYYEKSDVFVLTSKEEGLGVVLLEAMSNKVPVVSTNAGGTSEIVHNNKTGILVNDRNPKTIAKAIIKANKNKSILTKNASKFIDEKFKWNNIGQQYLNLYQRVTLEKAVTFDETKKDES